VTIIEKRGKDSSRLNNLAAIDTHAQMPTLKGNPLSRSADIILYPVRSSRLIFNGSLGIAVSGYTCGGILQAELAKYPEISLDNRDSQRPLLIFYVHTLNRWFISQQNG